MRQAGKMGINLQVTNEYTIAAPAMVTIVTKSEVGFARPYLARARIVLRSLPSRFPSRLPNMERW